MEASSSSSSASGGSTRWKYDVYLSFRGEDTQNNFTDHLYAALNRNGIITFKDDERLKRGTQISSELTKAIEESRFSIVIFSKNYASSTWCLEELAKIVEFMETNNNHTVIPVFFNVYPSDVRKQKGEFKKAFDKHQQNPKIEWDKIQRWRAALELTANIVGDFISAGRPVAKLVEDIVKDICGRLHISSFDGDQSKYVVGMDYHWKKMNVLLQVESVDVRFIGICGMGGIGKTTIARYVYDKLSYQYEDSCFLGDVRQECERRGVRQECERRGGRVISLQELLLSKAMKQTIRISSVHEGINLIRRWLGRKKVLIVLDDVDDQLEQLIKLMGIHDWFGPKSRIIVTTRDEQVLKSHAIIYIYKVGGLNGDDALQLFRMNAFKNEHPTDDHVNLSSDFVNYASGIPLVLEVLGSHLCDTTVEHWKSTLDSLKDYPDGKILKALRISYDHGLKQSERDIFLYIACFFKGKKKDRVMKILDSCDLYSISGIKVLVDKSLMTISDNRLGMHDLLQEMGWEIVREKHPNVCGKWSRLWLFKDVHHVLTHNTGTDEVKGIMLNNPKERIFRFNGKSFSSMSNLMLLELSNVDVIEHRIYLPNNLRFFKWHGCPLKILPSNFEARNLFELNLCGSQINYLWMGMKDFPKLKTIKLRNSHNLIETPDFTMVPNLKILDLKGCTRLCKVHESVGVLKSLIVLNLEGCKNLKIFPVFSGLKSLKILNLQGCSKLDKFPKNLEKLLHLEELKVGGTLITQVPSSIAWLMNLQKLSFQKCNSQPWWSSYLLRTNTRCLVPPSLTGLSSLKRLDLSECNLLEGTLLKDLDSLYSLKELDLSKNNFISLPESIKRLSKLEFLNLENCGRLRSLPELPSNIRYVWAEGCHLLEEQLVNCPKLIQNRGHHEINLAVMLLKQRLQLHDAGKEEFESNEKLVDRPPRLPVIEELKSLDSNVVQLKSDDEFASQCSEHRTDVSIISHSSPGESFRLFPENSSIKHEGAPFYSDSYDPINQLYPPDILHDISSPFSLKNSEISQLEELPPRLHSLKISECPVFKMIPPRLRIVDGMQLHDACKDEFESNEKLVDRPPRLPVIEELKSLDSNVVQLKSADEFALQRSEHRTDVSITSHISSRESFKLLPENPSIKHEGASSDSDGDDLINIWYPPDILHDISSPISLKVSEISQLEELPPRLHSLKIEGCDALKSLPQEVICSSPHLQHLYIIDCCYLELFQEGHLPVALKSLYIRNCRKLDFLSLAETMHEHALLEHLCMGSSCDSLRCFPLTFFPKLRSLSIWDSANFDSISITKNHMSLHAIEIRDCHKLLYFPKGGLLTPNLTSILLSNCKNLKVLPDQLYRLTSLQSLLINECPELDSIPEGGFPCSLDLLRITSCNKLTPCTEWGMNKLNNLSCFEIEGGCRDLESFPEEKLLPSNLNFLRISRASNLKFLDYKGLEHLKSLETLEINCCDKLRSLPEKDLPSSLTFLYIKECPLLGSKLQNRRGKEWCKISHIPNIQID